MPRVLQSRCAKIKDDDKPDGLTCKKCGEYKPINGFTKNRYACMALSLSAKHASDRGGANTSGYTPNEPEMLT